MNSNTARLWLLSMVCFLLTPGCQNEAQDNCLASPDPVRRSFHEQQFARDPQLTAHLADTVALQLHATGTGDTDTGGEGYDAIPYDYHVDTNHAVCFEHLAEGEQLPHYLLIKNEQGEELLRVNAGECQQAFFPKGRYLHELHHGQKGQADAEPGLLFLRPELPWKSGFFTSQGRSTAALTSSTVALRQEFTDSTSTLQQALTESGALRGAVDGCSDVDMLKYSEIKLQMPHGHVAVIEGTCPPADDTVLTVYRGSCNLTGQQATGLVVAAKSQAILFSESAYSGLQRGIINNDENLSQTTCLLDKNHNSSYALTAATASIAVSGFSAADGMTCKVERSGHYCYCGVSGSNCGCRVGDLGSGSGTGNKNWGNFTDVASPGAGEVLLLGSLPQSEPTKEADKCCTYAHVLKQGCRDLNLIGFDGMTQGVIFGDTQNRVVQLYGDKGFKGLSYNIDPLTYGSLARDMHTLYRTLQVQNVDGGRTDLPVRGIIASVNVTDTVTMQLLTTISQKACSHCDLSNADLTGAQLSNAQLSNANLTGTKLDGAQLDGANLSNATMLKATCTKTNFSNANLTGAIMSTAPSAGDTDLQNATLDNAVLRNTILKNIVARGVTFLKAQLYKDTSDSPGNTYGPQADWASLESAILVKADFTSAIIVNADLSSATVSGAKFTEATIVNTHMKELKGGQSSESQRISFKEALLYGVDFTNTSLDYATLTGAQVSFNSGIYCLTHIDGFNSETNEYNTITDQIQYDATFPDKIPKSTIHTYCPDGAGGPCDSLGGESASTCPDDCTGVSECSRRDHCLSAVWTAGSSSPGHWSCRNGSCSACEECKACKGCVSCGDGICDLEYGESSLSCPKDCCQCSNANDSGKICGTTDASCTCDGSIAWSEDLECTRALHCVSKPWPTTLTYHARWKCENGKCVPSELLEANYCGDGTCDRDGRWTAQKPANYLGTNDPLSWTKPNGVQCAASGSSCEADQSDDFSM